MAPKGSNSIALLLWRWIPSLSPCLLPALPLNLSQILSHVSSDGSSAPTRRQQPAAAGPRPEAFLFLLRLPLRRGTPPRGHRLPRGVRLVVPDLALPPPVAARRHHWRVSGPSGCYLLQIVVSLVCPVSPSPYWLQPLIHPWRSCLI
jgi:hypothetical protein